MTNNVTKSGLIGKSPISVGRFTYGFENINVRQWNEGAALKIGAFCSIASNCTIFLGGNHRSDWITTFPFGHIYLEELGCQHITGCPSTRGDVVIGNDVWIGSNVTIMSGIKIGHGAVLAANAHIVKDVMPYDIIGGNPGKLIYKRFDDDIVELLLILKWWELDLNVIRQIAENLCSIPTSEFLNELIKKYR